MNSNQRSNDSLRVAVNRRLHVVIISALILLSLLCVATGDSAYPTQEVINISGSGLAALISAVVVAATALMTALISLAKMVNHMNNDLIHHSIESLEEDFTRKENGNRYENDISNLTKTMNLIAQRLTKIETKLDMIEKHLVNYPSKPYFIKKE